MTRLSKLTLQAFRGVPSSLTLDFSAPLTLIHAPNGTGKTSICESIEWLLTGSVQRFKNSGPSGELLRCRFSPASVPTAVAATLTVSGKEHCIERTLDDCRWSVGGAQWRKVSQSELLEALAPGAVDQAAHGNYANPSRQSWLRGARFLSGDSLAALLGSDPDSIVGRERLFADLLGVGHLLETERQLDNYIAELTRYVQEQGRRVGEKDAKISTLEAALANASDEEPNMLDRAVLDAINTASTLLGLQSTVSVETTDASATVALQTLRVEAQARRKSIDTRQQAEVLLTPDWPQRNALLTSLAEDQHRLAALNTELKTTEEALGRAREALASSDATVRHVRSEIKSLQEIEKTLGSAYLPAKEPIASFLRRLNRVDLTADEMFHIIDSEGPIHSLEDRLQRIRRLLAELPTILVRERDLAALKLERESIRKDAPSPETIERLRAEASASAATLEALRAKYHTTAGPLEQVRILAQTIAESLVDEDTNCPACNHDWQTAESLRRALLGAAEQTAPSLARLADQLRTEEVLQQRLVARSVDQAQQLARIIEVEDRIAQLESARSRFAADLAAVGLRPESPHLHSELETAAARLELAPLIETLRECTRRAETALSTAFRDTSILHLHDLVRSTLLRATAERNATLQTREHDRASQQSLESDLAARANEIARTQTTIVRRIERDARRLQVLREAWESLAPNQEWSDAAFKSASDLVRKERENVQRAERAISMAEDLLHSILNRKELTQLHAERAELLKELEQLEQHLHAGESAKRMFHSCRREHTKQQMAAFVRVISALFVRMQSNLVYDDIFSGDTRAPLSWHAIAEKYSVDPEAMFSQGQRQDFALSIFLARARGLGGTFVLDEPIAHLDDLNRVALLDVFRAIVLEGHDDLSFVLTSSSRSLLRHMAEKFARLDGGGPSSRAEREPLLRIIDLNGSPRVGVRLAEGIALSSEHEIDEGVPSAE